MSRSRPRSTTIVTAILLFVIVIVVLQLWLFTATVHAYLGGDSSIVVPAGVASAVCLALIGGLLAYLYRLER
jgi:hypothetical protein